MWAIVATAALWMTEASYVPQVIRLWGRKQSSQINLFFPVMNLTGRLLLMLYTWHVHQSVLAAGFCFGLLLRGVFFGQVLYYSRDRRARVQAASLAVPVVEGSVNP